MVKLTGKPPKGFRRAIVGSHLAKQTKSGTVIQSWPPKRGRATQGYQLYREAEFGMAGKMTARALSLDRAAAESATAKSQMVWRDLLQRCIMGTALNLTMKDGRTVRSARLVTQNPLYWLDLLSDVPGAIVYRAEIGWIALLPGAAGKVLTIDDDGTTPKWKSATGGVPSVFGRSGNVLAQANDYTALLIEFDPSGTPLSATNVQTAIEQTLALISAITVPTAADLPAWLDVLNNVPGSMLYRNGSGWVELPPGTAGQVLYWQGVGALQWDDLPDPPTGSGYMSSSNTIGLANATSAASNGGLLVPIVDFDVIWADFNVTEVNGATYQVGIYELSSNTITAITKISAPQTAVAAGVNRRRFVFTPPAQLIAGTRYALLHTRTDATDTTASQCFAGSLDALGLPVQIINQSYNLPRKSPAIGGTCVSGVGPRFYSLTWYYP